jgi:Fe-S-cluster-containing hydrogenase component 2
MIDINHEKCDRCATCVAVCPVDALLFVEKIAVDAHTCISCGKCVTICPYGAIALTKSKSGTSV